MANTPTYTKGKVSSEGVPDLGLWQLSSTLTLTNVNALSSLSLYDTDQNFISMNIRPAFCNPVGGLTAVGLEQSIPLFSSLAQQLGGDGADT